MSAPAKPTYQQLVTSALGDYKKQSAQAIVKEVAVKRGETDQNKCRHFVKLTLKKMVEKKLITQVSMKRMLLASSEREKNSRNK